jgi:hypothetical protein
LNVGSEKHEYFVFFLVLLITNKTNDEKNDWHLVDCSIQSAEKYIIFPFFHDVCEKTHDFHPVSYVRVH